MAVTDMGLSPQEFWRLTWYEWGLYCLRLYKESKMMLAQRELSIDLTRHFMALFANANRAKGTPVFTPQDFFGAISSDQNIVEERELTYKEKKALYGSRIRKIDGRQ